MKRLVSLIIAALLAFGACCGAEGALKFEYQYDTWFCYDAGTQVCITAKYLSSETVTAQLVDEDGTVISEKEFSPSNRQRTFVFDIPMDWTGCHMLSVYVNGEKCAKDFPVFVKVREKVIKRVDTEEKKMAITIDFGSGTNWHAERWLDLLAKYDVKATFFITGFWASLYPETVKKIADAGHEIGCHSWSHAHLDKVKSWDEYYHELNDTNDIIESITGVRPTLFRVPYGDWSYTINTVCDYLDMPWVIQWNISSHDSDESNSDSFILAHAMPAVVPNGSIVLFHCGNPAIDRMGPAFDYYINTCGMTLVTVGELIGDGENVYVDDEFVLRSK